MARILIVDDTAANREYLTTLLGYQGHQLSEACDGAEALGVARATAPELIITDILMPTMDGYEFVRQLRLDPKLSSTAVIFCTADYHEREAMKLAADCGVSNLLFKPCEPEVVLRTVAAALGLAASPVVHTPAEEFDRDHLRLLTNKLSLKTGELQAVNHRLAALVDIGLRLAAEPEPHRLLESVCRSGRDLIGAKYGAIAAGPENAAIASHFFTSGIPFATALEVHMPALRQGVLGKILSEGRGCRLGDLLDSPAMDLPSHFPAVSCWLGAPISSLTRTYGWLCFGGKIGGDEFTAEDERLVSILGTQVGRMYENVMLCAEAQRHAAELQQEAAERSRAQLKLREQLSRLDLLHHITRAIGERQDLQSIFQVVIRSLEDSLPIDFGCICLYEPLHHMLTVTSVGIRSSTLAMKLAMRENARIPIDANGLSRCVQGQLVYEAHIDAVPFAFPQRLALGGLRALVVAPLLAESKVFGVLVAARHQPASFSSSDCEFLRQLSEHVALAAHQAQLYSALQQSYQELRQSRQAITQQERLSALGQMASGIAHDINNAISPVALYTESLLELETNLSERARKYLRIIQLAIEDVTQTVGRMREFYRPRDAVLSSLPVGLNTLVQQVIELTRPRWRDAPQARGVVIVLQPELESNLPDIIGIESEVRDALTNLVFNGIDAMPEGGTLTIRTRADRILQGVYLEVADTGVGMDDDTRRRCLEPFFTTKGERGTGLGLAMVYGMAQRHSAETEIDSTLGKGTTLRLIFPVAARGAATPKPESVEMPPRSLAILIVDDDPVILESMRATLQGDGHIITAADGGQAGIDAFSSAERSNQPFAVVITDLGMPHIDGRKVAAAVKAGSPATPVILLTGWGQRMSADNEVPPHIDRVLSKPPRLAQLRSVLAEVVRGNVIASVPG